MSRAELIRMAKRNLDYVKADTVEQAQDVYRVPAANYYDPVRGEQEMDRIFKRLPLVLGFSSEIKNPGDYRAFWAGDTPVLLTRTKDGALRGFLNVCSHRGAVVVSEGTGNARRFSCPYHAWTYDNEGRLARIHKQNVFGELDTSCLGLTALPVTERAGLIFGALTPNPAVDFDTYLAGYDKVLECLGLAECTVAGRQAVTGPNWKVAYDGYLDLYHLPILHRETFGPKMPSDTIYDAYGPHQRVTAPNPFYLKFEDKPEEEWPTEHMMAGVWTIFPHISIADFDAGGKLYMVSQLFPGPSVDESVTIQNFLAVGEVSDERQEQINGVMKFLEHVVRDEDYYTGNLIQKAAKTGAKDYYFFGRNEAGGQRFHRFVDELLLADDDQLPKLFAEGISV